MNSCVLMAKIVEEAQLRSTQDGVNVSSMLVEFPSSREGEDPGKIQVEGWGNLAEEMKNSYSAGDNIIIEGRLSMNLFEMPEGYKEKRAKLVASRIYPIGGSNTSSTAAASTNSPTYESPSNVVDFASTMQTQSTTANSTTTTATAPSEANAPQADNNEDWDEIPF